MCNSGLVRVISQLLVALIYFCDENLQEVVLNMNVKIREVEMERARDVL